MPGLREAEARYLSKCSTLCKMTKKELRKKFTDIRNSVPPQKRENDSRKVCRKFTDSIYYKNAKTVFLYISFGSEVSTIELVDKVIQDKGYVVVPLCNTEKHTMRLIKIDNKDCLEKGAYGISEPKKSLVESGRLKEVSSIDIAVVPGLAFDNTGARLGYGGGYYDRFLCGFKGISVGFLYDECYTDSLPTEEYDCSVDMIITPKEMKIWRPVI